MLSVPESMKRVMGTRLIRKAVLTVRVMVVGEFEDVFDTGSSRVGVRMMANVRSREVLRSSVVSITFTWICTKMGGS